VARVAFLVPRNLYAKLLCTLYRRTAWGPQAYRPFLRGQFLMGWMGGPFDCPFGFLPQASILWRFSADQNRARICLANVYLMRNGRSCVLFFWTGITFYFSLVLERRPARPIAPNTGRPRPTRKFRARHFGTLRKGGGDRHLPRSRKKGRPSKHWVRPFGRCERSRLSASGSTPTIDIQDFARRA